MKRIVLPIIMLSVIHLKADESLALKAAQDDLKNINARIAQVENNSSLSDELTRLKHKKYDREREIHHWEMLSNLHSKNN